MNIALKIKIVEITMNFILNSFKIAQILILSMDILIWLLWIQVSLLYCRNSYFKCDSHFKFKECSRSDVYYCLHTDASLFFYEKCTMYTHLISEKEFFLIFFSPEMNIHLVFFNLSHPKRVNNGLLFSNCNTILGKMSSFYLLH